MSNMELPVVGQMPKLRAMDSDNIPGVAIRRATPADAGAAFALVEEYFCTIGVMLRETQPVFIAEYFGEGKGIWLAQVEGELAGCIGLRKLQPSNARQCDAGNCAEIKRMYVRDKFRGQGIAQKLLQAAERFARETGYTWIYLDTTNEMKAAARLYQRNGFEPCERYNQNPQAAIFMRKSITSDCGGA